MRARSQLAQLDMLLVLWAAPLQADPNQQYILYGLRFLGQHLHASSPEDERQPLMLACHLSVCSLLPMHQRQRQLCRD